MRGHFLESTTVSTLVKLDFNAGRGMVDEKTF